MTANPHTIRRHVKVELPSRCRLVVAALLIVWVCTACVMSYSSQHCGFCLCPNSEATPAVANIHMPWQNSHNNIHMPWQNSQNNIHMPWQNSQNNIYMPWQNSQICVHNFDCNRFWAVLCHNCNMAFTPLLIQCFAAPPYRQQMSEYDNLMNVVNVHVVTMYIESGVQYEVM